MPLHRFPVRLWPRLRLREGLASRLPAHYLRSLDDERPPAPVHYRPHGARYKVNPRNGQRERVQDVPIPLYWPREAQQGLWGGEGWILGQRYVNNDKVGGARSPACSASPSAGGTRGSRARGAQPRGAAPAAVQAREEGVEAAAVPEAAVQRDPGPDLPRHGDRAHAGPHRRGLRL